MNSLNQILQNDTPGGMLLLVLGYLLVVLLPTVAVLYLLFYLLTLPMRRNERIRVFLDLIEMGIKDGRTPESTLIDAAASRDRLLGRKFPLLAALLQEGYRLSQALEQVPRLVSPQVRAMIKVGERAGDLSRILSACRLLLRDSISDVRGALNYLLILALVATPFGIGIPLVIKYRVLPSFKAVFTGMYEDAQLPAFTRFVFAENTVFVGVQVAAFMLVWLAVLVYLGGPRLRDLLEIVLLGNTRWIDWLAYRVPWRRTRLQRDFSGMMAALLEAGVPEGEAVQLAGESTANMVMRRRAGEVCERLKQGLKLPEALLVWRDAGQLRWRMANALQGRGEFSRALSGWHETLDAKAFQLEQTGAQLLTTLLVLINGALIGCIVIGMFIPLIELINRMTLW